MTTIETTDQRIERLEAELAAAKAERDRPKVWKPWYGGWYWFISGHNEVLRAVWDGGGRDCARYSIGNVFLTEESARRERDRRILIADMRRWAEERGLRLKLEAHFGYDNLSDLAKGEDEFVRQFADRLHLLSGE